MDFSEVINQRVSTRSFSSEMVPDEEICYLFECAQKAPSWMNKQCWQFIVVKDPETIKEIAKTSVINRWLKQAPIIIIACADPKQSGMNNDISYFITDVSIALEHLILAATDHGLGTCWVAGFNEQKIKQLLEIPPRIKVVALTPLGYPAQKKTLGDQTRKLFIRSTKRKSLQEIVHWGHW